MTDLLYLFNTLNMLLYEKKRGNINICYSIRVGSYSFSIASFHLIKNLSSFLIRYLYIDIFKVVVFLKEL